LLRFRLFPAFLLTACALAGACGGNSTTPSPPSPPVDPLRVTCPAPVTLTSSNGQPLPVRYGLPTTSGGTPPIQVTCTPASDSTFNIGATTVTCTATDSKSITSSCTFAITVAAPPRITFERFLAFGDSMTLGEDGNSSTITVSAQGPRLGVEVLLPFADTYPGGLQTQLRARYTMQTPVVTNAGKPLEAVTDSTTFPRFVGLTSTGQFSVVLLMEGANDLASRDARVFPTVISGLRRMIIDARGRGLRVFLATIPPENPAGFRALAWSLVPAFNDQLRLLATSENVPLVDVYQAFNGDLSLISFDGLHPNANGYHKIADTFFALIKQALEASSASTPTALPHILPRR
jgi:lysophospholipase L1-like esterase